MKSIGSNAAPKFYLTWAKNGAPTSDLVRNDFLDSTLHCFAVSG
jgi:hypothetical protein